MKNKDIKQHTELSIYNSISSLFYDAMYERSKKQKEYIEWKNKSLINRFVLSIIKDIHEEDFIMNIFEISSKMVAYTEILDKLNIDRNVVNKFIEKENNVKS